MKKRASIKDLIEIARELRDTGGVAHGLFTKLRPKEVQDEMTDMTPELPAGVEIGQRMYHLREEMSEIPKCPVCEKDRAWYRYSNGYFETCGDKHCKQTVKAEKFKETVSSDEFADKKKEWFGKQKQTMLERYGVDHNWKGDLRKTGEETMLERYGVKHALQGEEAQEKRRRTTEERHGTLDMFSLGRETVKEKYGVENAMQNEEVKKRNRVNMKNSFKIKSDSKLTEFNLEQIGSDKVIYKLVCWECKSCFVMRNGPVNYKLRMKETPCPNCNPPDLTSSKMEKELATYIHSLGVIQINTNDKSVLRGTKFMEVDIYIPDEKIAIEFNGLYWHSELFKNKNYHQEKTRILLERGIMLYHVWEDDWIGKKPIIKSMIGKILGKNIEIDPMECDIRNIDNEQYKIFLKENSLIKYEKPSEILGLLLNGELMVAMAFKRSKAFINGIKEAEWKICSIVNKIGISANESEKTLFQKFLKMHPGESVLAYSGASFDPDPDNSIFHRIGMTKLKTSDPDYEWVLGGVRMPKISRDKKEFEKWGYDKCLSEKEVMKDLGAYRIWNCGEHKFIYRS
jgi:hypothetical protein